jgi:tetraacyldisaccharide 4'-kinase
MPVLRTILLPFSWLYGSIVWLRNVAYDRGWLKAKRGELPTVVIGNIHMGGTGKTPHTLWLAKALRKEAPGILSRGYGRKTKGFRWVERDAKASDVGDEPLLYRNELPESVAVAVCEDRLVGIRRFRGEKSDVKMVLLDDAMQHRKLLADVYIALVRKDRLPADDHYFPAGNLRDHRRRMRAADVLIVTGYEAFTPDFDPDKLRDTCHVSPTTPVFRSKITYGQFDAVGTPVEAPQKLLVVTGIANPGPLLEHLREAHTIVEHLNYPDHHRFAEKDLSEWKHKLQQLQADALVTTLKDFERIKELSGASDLPLLLQPIEVEPERGDELIQLIQARLRNQNTSE